jgi:hypothetical protein
MNTLADVFTIGKFTLLYGRSCHDVVWIPVSAFQRSTASIFRVHYCGSVLPWNDAGCHNPEDTMKRQLVKSDNAVLLIHIFHAWATNTKTREAKNTTNHNFRLPCTMSKSTSSDGTATRPVPMQYI